MDLAGIGLRLSCTEALPDYAHQRERLNWVGLKSVWPIHWIVPGTAGLIDRLSD
jgi:hypothetical protein